MEQLLVFYLKQKFAAMDLYPGQPGVKGAHWFSFHLHHINFLQIHYKFNICKAFGLKLSHSLQLVQSII